MAPEDKSAESPASRPGSAQSPAEQISFARGAPSADILPREAVRDAAAAALANDWQKALSYGVGIGHPGLCEWISERHDLPSASHVMVTNGSLEAGAMLFEYALEPGDRVIVEQPSYDRTLLLIGRLGVDIVGVPLEDDGIDVDALERELETAPVKFVHVIPNFHNPAGCTLSERKRRRLVELAREHEFWLFEDDPYREICFGEVCPPTMLSMAGVDGDVKIVHASSFSKTVSPGVRVGYLAGPIGAIQDLAKRANETYISPNMLAESIVLELCRSGGLDRNIEVVCAALNERCSTLVDALREQIPEAEFVVPGGGYFLWLDLPDDVDTEELALAAKEQGVSFIAGPDFMLEGGRSSLRLSFASVPADQIPDGVGRIAKALAGLRAKSPA